MNTSPPLTVVDLEIDGIAAGGDGVGRDREGRVVFVPLTAPGDRIRAVIIKSKPRWARGIVSELLTESAHRRQAPCPVFGVCGGCRLQHLPPERQVEAKRRIVQDALERIGGISCEVAEPIRAGSELEYRNRITLTVRGSDVGFHGLYDARAVISISDCLVAEPPIRAAVDALSTGHLLPTGGELRVTIRANAMHGTALFVEGGVEPGSPMDVVDRISGLESYWWRDSAGRMQLLAGRPTFREMWQGLEFELPPEVFLQCNREVSAAMDAWLDDRVGSPNGRCLVDLYAGVGARAIRWAVRGGEVATCEVDGAACDTCDEAALHVGARVRVVCGRAEDQFSLLQGAEIVVVNPPRTGLSIQLREALVAARVPGLAYVSCDPATLARDLKGLERTYEVLEIQPFDAFPQTAHIETIVWMVGTRPVATG